MPAGINFREGKAGHHFSDSDPFLLHTVKGTTSPTFNFKVTSAQRAIREKLYGVVAEKGAYSLYGGNIKTYQ